VIQPGGRRVGKVDPFQERDGVKPARFEMDPSPTSPSVASGCLHPASPLQRSEAYERWREANLKWRDAVATVALHMRSNPLDRTEAERLRMLQRAASGALRELLADSADRCR
jgi:hypothetical protein